MTFPDPLHLHSYILQLEQEGRLTRTFRRLDPERQSAVLQAILDEAAERGPTSLNIKQVAQRAGVSVGSLYQYFPDRDGMLDCAVALCVRYVTDVFNEYRAYLANLPLREGLRWYLAGGIEWGQSQAGFVHLYARAAYQGDPELAGRLVKPIAELLLDMVREMLTKAQERGEVRLDVDLDSTARLVHALTIAVGDSLLLPYLNTYFQVNDPLQPFERTLETMLDLILSGIGIYPAAAQESGS